jgi:hypothetical protein
MGASGRRAAQGDVLAEPELEAREGAGRHAQHEDSATEQALSRALFHRF